MYINITFSPLFLLFHFPLNRSLFLSLSPIQIAASPQLAVPPHHRCRRHSLLYTLTLPSQTNPQQELLLLLLAIGKSLKLSLSLPCLSLASVLDREIRIDKDFFFSFFPFSPSLLSVFSFWVLGPFGSCLLWVYDSETREWVFLFLLRMGSLFCCGVVNCLGLYRSVTQSIYTILFFG